MIIKASLILLLAINVSQCEPGNRFDWESSIESIIDEIREKNDEYDSSATLNDRLLPTYDFVVIGSGSGGSTCAAGILDAQPNARILMLEAGTHNLSSSLFEYENGGFWVGSEYDWNDTTEFDSVLNRAPKIANGFALGGSSTINFMNWIRGDPNDFNSWATIVGDDSWNYQNLLKYFRKIEKFTESNSRYRGRSGNVFVTRKFTESSYVKNYEAIISSSLGLALNPDYNSETVFGVSTGQFNVKPIANDRGIRQDAFSTQLEKHLPKRTFHVLTSAYGDKVVLTADNKAVRYLVFQHNGRSYKVRALKDVVVSAGTLRSPLVLLRSGIGDCTSLGAACKVNLPGVGKNLDYHPLTPIILQLNGTIPPSDVVFHVVTGKINVQGTELAKHQIIPFYIKKRPAAGPNILLVASIQSHVRARGEVSLKSLDPTDRPRIQLNVFQDPLDMDDQLEGIEIVDDIAASLSSYIGQRIAPPSGSTRQGIIDYVKESVEIYHVAGTCKMGASSDSMAVVDSKLKVRGIRGLRVVDASIMPHVTSCNTNSPTMMIGARGAHEILKEHYPRG